MGDKRDVKRERIPNLYLKAHTYFRPFSGFSEISGKITVGFSQLPRASIYDGSLNKF